MSQEYMQSLYKYLTNNYSIDHSNIIKQHTKQLDIGDLSFPIQMKSWHTFLIEDICRERLKTIEKDPQQFVSDLISESEKWPIPIQTVTLTSDHCFLRFKRECGFKVTLKKVFEQNDKYGYDIDRSFNYAFVHSTSKLSEDSLTELRIKTAIDVCKNFLCKLGCTIKNTPDGCDLNLNISRHVKKEEDTGHHVSCGVVSVLGAPSNNIPPKDFIEKRSLQMQLLAQHKYGIRFSSNCDAHLLCKQLGESTVKFELLQVKLSKPLTVNIENHASCSSKGISFILYNYARISSMCDTFDTKVSEGIYPDLPAFEDIDCKLFCNNLEWEILYCYILRFPAVVNDCVRDIKSGYFNVHYLCNFLSGFVGVFSVYYKNVKILASSYRHMSSLIHARIYFIKAIEIVIKNSLVLLDIAPVKRM